ncbi:P-loop containing nucleoside triphosphate hydrolase protein [Zopfochytrium polystomum]|nr:P-loop containing nucleoside triphosphate hydrolase protein [Zopfochytrium polystomum]
MMDDATKREVIGDAQEFLRSELWYADRGIPYRRGYMLYGPPGTGKTSFVTALAGKLGLNIYVISLANKGLTDETLTELMTCAPRKCILLIEDIDAAFVHRSAVPATAASSDGGSGGAAVTNVTFSGLLNAIDGVAAQEGRMLVMTTNHLEKLDQALIRPGRIDVRIFFGNATRATAQQLFLQFYSYKHEQRGGGRGGPGADTAAAAAAAEELARLAAAFAREIPEERLSMAAIQGYLMRHKGGPAQAVDGVVEWVAKSSRRSGEPAESGEK